MKLTKLQRYTAYTLMLTEAQSKNYIEGRGGYLCLCFLAYDLFSLSIHGTVGEETEEDNFKITFPELLNKRPKELYKDAYWFNPNDHKSRIELLKQCIQETHP